MNEFNLTGEDLPGMLNLVLLKKTCIYPLNYLANQD